MALFEKKLETYILLSSLLFSAIFYSISMRGDNEQMQLAYDYRFEEAVLESKMHRGINIGNALEAPKEGDWGVYIRDEYFRIIREAGFDTVRIPIRWSAHAEKNPPYRIDEDFFNRVDWVVSKSLEQNLITIINIHHYEEIMQDPSGHSDRFKALWSQISEHYKDYSEKLYFELLNEPYGELTDEKWNMLIRETVEIIRRTNPIRKIIIGPTGWNSVYNLKGLVIPEDENIIVTFHFYTPFEFTHQGAEWVSPSPAVGRKWLGTEAEKKQITEELDMAVQWAAQHGDVPLFMGEFGAYSKADMHSRVRWTRFVAREAEKRGIAWCYWEFCAGFGAYDQDKGEWRTELLNALISEKHYVTVETEYGNAFGTGWYDEGSYVLIGINTTSWGFYVFDHFEGLGPRDRMIDERTVEIYVDGLRMIKAVWRIDYVKPLAIALVFFVAFVVAILYKRRVLKLGEHLILGMKFFTHLQNQPACDFIQIRITDIQCRMS
ncbi:MAG: glycoside hydrolase family 5 protein [Crenarchaeota archaeon]|nr:glycoside hydrolase family 5 protein [Thermoproteota archaeon]